MPVSPISELQSADGKMFSVHARTHAHTHAYAQAQYIRAYIDTNVRTHTLIHTYVRAYTYIHTDRQTDRRTHTHICTHTRTYTHIYIRAFIHTCARTHTHTCVCVCARVITPLAAPVRLALYKYKVSSYVFRALTYFVPLRFKCFSLPFLVSIKKESSESRKKTSCPRYRVRNPNSRLRKGCAYHKELGSAREDARQ